MKDRRVVWSLLAVPVVASLAALSLPAAGQIVVPKDVSVPKAHEVLSETGIGDERIDARVTDLAGTVVAMAAALRD